MSNYNKAAPSKTSYLVFNYIQADISRQRAVILPMSNFWLNFHGACNRDLALFDPPVWAAFVEYFVANLCSDHGDQGTGPLVSQLDQHQRHVSKTTALSPFYGDHFSVRRPDCRDPTRQKFTWFRLTLPVMCRDDRPEHVHGRPTGRFRCLLDVATCRQGTCAAQCTSYRSGYYIQYLHKLLCKRVHAYG